MTSKRENREKMKVKNILLALAIVTGISTGSLSSISADASTWHKGIPREIRGNFETKEYGANLTMGCTFRAKSLVFGASGMPTQVGYNVHYKKLHRHSYLLRYDAHADGLFKGGKKLKMPVKRVGKNLRVFGYKIIFHRQSVHAHN